MQREISECDGAINRGLAGAVAHTVELLGEARRSGEAEVGQVGLLLFLLARHGALGLRRASKQKLVHKHTATPTVSSSRLTT